MPKIFLRDLWMHFPDGASGSRGRDECLIRAVDVYDVDVYVGAGGMPFDLRAIVWSKPAEITAQSVAQVDSWVGVGLLVVVPSPSWPCQL
jgi:hypothetical protein